MDYQPKHKWRETWLDESHQDFAAWEGDLQFGRIFLDLTSLNKGPMDMGDKPHSLAEANDHAAPWISG